MHKCIRWLACVLILVSTVPAFAVDDKKDPPKETVKLKGHLPFGWGKLGLSEEQKQKVYAIQAEYKSKLADLEAKLIELRKVEKAELNKVLSDDQKARLKDALTSKVPGAGEPVKKPEEKKPDEKKPDEKKPDEKK